MMMSALSYMNLRTRGLRDTRAYFGKLLPLPGYQAIVDAIEEVIGENGTNEGLHHRPAEFLYRQIGTKT